VIGKIAATVKRQQLFHKEKALVFEEEYSRLHSCQFLIQYKVYCKRTSSTIYVKTVNWNKM